MAGGFPSPHPALRFGRCELNLATCDLRVAGMRQRVRCRVVDCIAYLALQRPRVIPNEELMRAVWQREAVSQAGAGACRDGGPARL